MVLTTEEMTKNGRGIYRLEICVKCRTQQKQSGLGAESPENSFSDKLRVSENTKSIGQPQPPPRTHKSTPFPDYLPYYENLHKLQTSYRTKVLTKFFSVVANFLTRACGPHRS